jgi:hypothetical protein
VPMNMEGQGMSPPAPFGSAEPSQMERVASSGLGAPGPDPMQQANQVQDELKAIQKLVDQVALQFPAAAGSAKTVASALESMLQEIVASMAPSPGSITQPPPLP